jgi:hypothetical protein
VNNSLVLNLAKVQLVAVLCVDSVCQKYNSAKISEQQIWSGNSGAVQSEMMRIDFQINQQSLLNLYLDTINYYNCSSSDDSCRNTYYQKANSSFAIHGYVSFFFFFIVLQNFF